MGYLRILLVLAVVHGHFIAFDNYWHHTIAVFGFYVLSGFLITHVVCEVYDGSMRGKFYYLANRFMRIYPTYWACLLVAILIGIYVPETSRSFRVRMFMPHGWQAWLPQWTIFGISGFSGTVPPRNLLAVSWSLSIELAYYLIIGLVTGRSRDLTLCVFILSLGLLGVMYYHDAIYAQYYFTIYGPAAVFFLGSLGYHYRQKLKKFYALNNVALLCIAGVVLCLPDILGMQKTFSHRHMPILSYVSACFFMLIIVGLYEGNMDRKISEIEQFCADISYPLFLIHYPLGALIGYYWQLGELHGYELFIPGLGISLLTATMVVVCVEYPIKKIRTYLREKGRESK